jgi:glycosyltransferase involved in cell wall biosynthesis
MRDDTVTSAGRPSSPTGAMRSAASIAPRFETVAAEWAVAIFAHNEERNIERCLDAVRSAVSNHVVQCIVLANGCRDHTEERVVRYMQQHAYVQLTAIELGDKANAWNEYVHRLAPAAAVHFFVDGDCRVEAHALSELAAALRNSPRANAAAALPGTGRNVVAARRAVVDGHELMGNLYALRGDFVDRLRRLGVRLPIGLIGDDSLVGALAKWDLETNGPWDEDRIVTAEGADFTFDSLSPFQMSDWHIYFARRVRYRMRAHQLEMLRPMLKERGVEALPSDIRSLYADYIRDSKPSGSGLDRVFDYFARRRMQRESAFTRAP